MQLRVADVAARDEPCRGEFESPRHGSDGVAPRCPVRKPGLAPSIFIAEQ